MDIECDRYVLPRHADLPDADRPVWTFSLATSNSLKASEAAGTIAIGDAEPRLDGIRYNQAALAIHLRSVSGMRRGLAIVPPFPLDADLDARIAWVQDHVPVTWILPLIYRIHGLAEVDKEEERGASV